ncbi:ESKIMO 1-like protein [Tanacetum coccineum]
MKFYDVPLVSYTSDGISLIVMKIGTPVMLDSYTNSICLVSWGWSSYARVLIKINACNDFSDNMAMAIPNLEGTGYTKETIRIEYKWKPPRCNTCLIFGHSFNDCLKAPKRVVNRMDKDKCQTFGADDEGFIEVKKKKSGGMSNSPKMTPFVGTNKASTLGYNKESPNNKGYYFEYTRGGKNIYPYSRKDKLVLVDDNGKPLEKVDYPVNSDSDDEVEPVENKTINFLVSNRVGYGPKHLWEQ